MNKLITLLLLGLVTIAYSACPNSCSGHGTCGNNDLCTCYEGWQKGDEDGGDCSDRKCHYEIAWADTPTADESAHALLECAGRGTCDRTTGECVCFPGFTGRGCRRSVCPNDCSGHGVCGYFTELRDDVGDSYKYTGYNSAVDQYTFTSFYAWDYRKSQVCKCDAGWTDVDCSRRRCPRGNYPLWNAGSVEPEVQQVKISDATSTYSDFALTFRTTRGEEFTTVRLNATYLAVTLTATEAETALIEALGSLPNKALYEVDVTVEQGTLGGGSPLLLFNVTFAGPQTTGDQYMLECRTEVCADGCQPYLMGISGVSATCDVTEVVAATSTNLECSGAGTCDYTTGLCSCFTGYTDEYCSTQTALL